MNMNNSREVTISVTTVKRRLIEAGLGGRIATRKSLLRPQNKKRRLQWAKQHEQLTVDDWKRVHWTDDSKFQIFGLKRIVYVRGNVVERMIKQSVVPTVKHGGGSVMVWGCCGGNNIGDIVEKDGIMTKEVYLSVLKNHAIPSGSHSHTAIPSGSRIIGEQVIFQEDNDPKHSQNFVIII